MARQGPERVIAYVDGFNLYFGMRAAGMARYYWLDVCGLAGNLLRDGQHLIETKYFTARIAGAVDGDSPRQAALREAKRKRQSDYLEALGTLDQFQMFEGHYLARKTRCNACGVRWDRHEEKMTDVQIATQMLLDAFGDRFDMALLISADSDLVPPVRAIRQTFPEKRIIAAFPPKRRSDRLRQSANAALTIGRRTLKKSQLPDEVVKAGGYTLKRPDSWR